MKTKNHEKYASALGLAYDAVVRLGYNGKRLVEENYWVNYPTLRRIRDGLNVRKSTRLLYHNLFVCLLDREYWRRVGNGGDGAMALLRVLHAIQMERVKEGW